MAIDTILGTVNTIIGLIDKPPTPEEQRAKAGVWYNMLDDWINNQPQTSIAFGDRWETFLPFKQKSTKRRFIQNNIDNKSDNMIRRTLIDKINDELVKGGFTKMSDSSILSGMGGGGGILDTSSSAGSSSTLSLSPGNDLQPNDIQESKTFFYIMAIVASAALILFLSFKPKKRRR